MSEETDESPNSDVEQKELRFFREIRAAAFEKGLIHLEAWVCEKCKTQNLFSHLGLETMSCMKCNHSYPSAVPREQQPGELAAMHYILAIKMIRDIALDQQRSELPALASHELLSLPLKLRHLLARHRTQVSHDTALRIDKIAEELAGIDGESSSKS